ncbi:hypothetical protein BZB76_4222 [Actinomadura pelletieri DSM 43383]|uniref:Uncharacterized protein n=1 Tax=Actinomadura pelletieri DSM 43383 TaxID=1120940 RepID=A0A495QLU4_9ACTN|nr:hypothetical protein [Actinomadura pelletieri]RKS73529.1 hypothetical protein BZB76_4222 [Actinomadura pelletieri DSM 43383]
MGGVEREHAGAGSLCQVGDVSVDVVAAFVEVFSDEFVGLCRVSDLLDQCGAAHGAFVSVVHGSLGGVVEELLLQ